MVWWFPFLRWLRFIPDRACGRHFPTVKSPLPPSHSAQGKPLLSKTSGNITKFYGYLVPILRFSLTTNESESFKKSGTSPTPAPHSTLPPNKNSIFQSRYFLHCMFIHEDISIFVIPWVSHVWLFVTPWTAACQTYLSFTISQTLLKLMSTESMMPSNHLILYCPHFLLPSIFPSIRVYSNESALYIRWWEYWNFGISPSNSIQCWYPLGLMSLISLLSKGLSRVFSRTTVQKHQFFST